MFLCGDWSRDDVVGIPFADSVPQKRRAKPPGADIGDVGAFCVSELPLSAQQPQSSVHLRRNRRRCTP